VKLNAFDYLLKPVKLKELMEKVTQAAEFVEQELLREKQYVESLSLLQQQFLKKLTNQADYEITIDVEKELTNLGIKLEGSNFSAILVHFNDINDENRECYQEELKSIIIDVLTDNDQGEVIDAASNELAIFLSTKAKSKSNQEMIALSISKNIKKQFKENVTVTIGRIYSNLFEIATSFVEARLAMNVRYLMKDKSIYSIDDISTSPLHNEGVLEQLDEELTKQIKSELPMKVKETLNKISRVLVENKNIQLVRIKLLGLKYSTLLTYEIKKWCKNPARIDTIEFYQEIFKIESLNEMIEILEKLVDEWADIMFENKLKTPSVNCLVEKAISYLENNYFDEELTQQKVADEVFVSAPYLSNLFKREIGTNFSDYLLELRMKKAMDLLKTESIKTYKVAEQVGYSNPQYFSISFKKFTGYTPSEFRKRSKESAS